MVTSLTKRSLLGLLPGDRALLDAWRTDLSKGPAAGLSACCPLRPGVGAGRTTSSVTQPLSLDGLVVWGRARTLQLAELACAILVPGVSSP